MKIVIIESDDLDFYICRKFDIEKDYFWHTKSYRKIYKISKIRFWWIQLIDKLFWDFQQDYLYKIRKGEKE